MEMGPSTKSKRRKLNDGGIGIGIGIGAEAEGEAEAVAVGVELDSFRCLQRPDRVSVEEERRKKDSLWRSLSDSVYDLHERMRSNDGLKHMIRTNLADAVRTEQMAECEKVHEVAVRHSIEHCCIWLRIRNSLARSVQNVPCSLF